MNNLRNYLSQLLERLKCCFVFTTRRLALWWLRNCDEWLEDRQKRAVESALDKTLGCGYVHGIDKND